MFLAPFSDPYIHQKVQSFNDYILFTNPERFVTFYSFLKWNVFGQIKNDFLSLLCEFSL